ncbi:MAG: ABC transporter substrate-binding protein [Gaiellaceae bacterium]
MRRKGWLAFAMLATGAGLLATAQFAGASSARYGGIFRVGTEGASVQVDPQIAYITTAWWLEYATAAKLYNWQDGTNELVPEAASGVKISNYGRTYTFTIRRGFRFSDGSPVTAKSFAYAIDRVANHDLASSGAQFITDPNGAEIVGAGVVNNGGAQRVSGVTTKGRRLVIRLVNADPTFLVKLTMPFFQATSTKLSLTHEVLSGYPSAGPYFFSRNDINVLTSIRRNPFWRRGPGRIRPRNLTGVDVIWNQDENQLFADVQAGKLDEDPAVPPAQVQAVADQYGVNKTRFWVKPNSDCLASLAFNTHRSLFKNNAPLRRAVSWAIDRSALVAVNAGPYAASAWTHLLPPGFPGSIETPSQQPYATTSRIAKARKIARGHFRSGRIAIGYHESSTVPSQALIVRHDLIKLGFKAENVGFVQIPSAPPIGWQSPADIAGVPSGWCADFPDPYNLLSFYLDPKGPFAGDSPKYWRKVRAANRLVGAARLRAFGRLDLEVARNVAPVDVIRTYNNRYLFSSRVVPHSLVYSGAYQDWDIGALALK